MQTFMIQAILGEAFEDLYITAATVEAALALAPSLTTLRHRFTRFVA